MTIAKTKPLDTMGSTSLLLFPFIDDFPLPTVSYDPSEELGVRLLMTVYSLHLNDPNQTYLSSSLVAATAIARFKSCLSDLRVAAAYLTVIDRNCDEG